MDGIRNMKLIWEVNDQDVQKILSFMEKYKNDPMVINRIERNVNGIGIDLSKSTVWFSLVSCLLTTQQRSGPESNAVRFINTKPFPLNYELCISESNLDEFSKKVIRDFGGLRFHNRLSEQIETNFSLLEGGLWNETLSLLEVTWQSNKASQERVAANFIDDHFKGFGPKQARNLLQSLGCTKYEIPVDSRITKWLNKFGFPVRLTAATLADQNYYHFVSDGIQALCKECGIYPCVLDAAIFVSYDQGGWTEENLVW
jgi:thermostable 8-oxoguanine DNA glycosylase